MWALARLPLLRLIGAGEGRLEGEIAMHANVWRVQNDGFGVERVLLVVPVSLARSAVV